MRAARKQLGFTQEEIAGRLEISQSALSKLEHGALIPSAPQWFEFCRITGISTESLMTGYIERNQPASLKEGMREGSFKINKRYAVHRGSKVRAMLPFLAYLNASVGEKKYREYFKSVKLDADYFIDLDNQVGLEFCLDLSRYLINQKFLKPNDLQKLVAPVSQPETHGSLHLRYDSNRGNKANLLNVLILNSRHYECNFSYRIEEQKRQHLDLAIEPERHLAPASYRHDPILGDFLCQYKKGYFSHFMHYGEREDGHSGEIHELECHYRGAPKCVYRIPLAG